MVCVICDEGDTYKCDISGMTNSNDYSLCYNHAIELRKAVADWVMEQRIRFMESTGKMYKRE